MNSNSARKIIAKVTFLFTLALMLFCQSLYATKPVLRITATPLTLELAKNAQGTVNFNVRNNSGKRLTITNQLVKLNTDTKVSFSIVSNNCGGVLNNNAGCQVSIRFNGGNVDETSDFDLWTCAFNGTLCSGLKNLGSVVVGSGGSTPTPTPTPTPTEANVTLTGGAFTIYSDLNLVPGNQAVITINNTSSNITATNIQANLPQTWGDVSQDASNCVSVSPGSSCQIILTAGTQGHASAGFTIQGDNTSSATATGTITRGGRAKCWGDNFAGQLGDNDAPNNKDLPVDVHTSNVDSSPLSEVTAIVTGFGHTCALLNSGSVKCWGDNVDGQLGDNDAPNDKATPIDVHTSNVDPNPLSGVVAIGTGGFHTCALLNTGAVKCWGRNDNGQLGDNDLGTDKHTPVDVHTSNVDPTPLSGVVSISTGGFHTCALLNTGAVKCWGNNGQGQLGDNDLPNDKATPIDVHTSNVDPTPLSGVVVIAAGFRHTCALLNTGAVKCWGDNAQGQLGDNDTPNDKATPVDVSGLNSGVVNIYAGGFHTCALLNTGAVKCWGDNSEGQLGDNDLPNDKATPIDVHTSNVDPSPLSEVVDIATGYVHTCALLNTGALKCWGFNGNGQLGDNDLGIDKPTPVDLVSLSNSVLGLFGRTVGGYHSCAITE